MKPITVDGGKGTVELDAEGVLHLVWKPGTVLEADDVHAAMTKVNQLADGAEYPMLIDISNTEAVTRQARSVFSVKCAASRIALLGSSPLSRVIANFAMARRTRPCPTRFFASRNEAMTWLLQASLPLPTELGHHGTGHIPREHGVEGEHHRQAAWTP